MLCKMMATLSRILALALKGYAFLFFALGAPYSYGFDVRGLTRESSVQDFKEKFPNPECKEVAAEIICRSTGGTYAGVRYSSVDAHFADGKPVKIKLAFIPELPDWSSPFRKSKIESAKIEHANVREAIEKKYGKPDAESAEVVGNRIVKGAIWRKLGWEIVGASLEENLYLFITFQTDEVAKREKQEEERQMGQRLKDM